MKKIALPFIVMIAMGCNNSGKDSVEKADSANEAKQDTAMKTNDMVADEASSTFLVRVANSGMAEVQMADNLSKAAYYPDVKSFAAMLYHDHSMVNDAVKQMAAARNITLPTTITDDKQADIDRLKGKTGKELDKEFIKTMIKNHTAGIDLFEKAVTETKDAEVNALANQTLPTLRAHLDSAKALDKKYWK